MKRIRRKVRQVFSVARILQHDFRSLIGPPRSRTLTVARFTGHPQAQGDGECDLSQGLASPLGSLRQRRRDVRVAMFLLLKDIRDGELGARVVSMLIQLIADPEGRVPHKTGGIATKRLYGGVLRLAPQA